MFFLNNKIRHFVLGAGGGIGRAACRVLSRDGATIIAVDRNLSAAKETAEAIGKQSHAIEIDVTSRESITNALKEILVKFQKPPSVIINAAGIIKDNFLLQLTDNEFDDVIKVNLKGTFLIMQHFANAMIEHNVLEGSIVNLSSIIGKIGNIGQANYAASKAGVEAMTRSASKEFGKYQIRANSILPGFIKTPMTDSVPQKVKDIMIRQCSLRRFGEPEEVAEVIAFLASHKSSYINGASIEVTGGW